MKVYRTTEHKPSLPRKRYVGETVGKLCHDEHVIVVGGNDRVSTVYVIDIQPYGTIQTRYQVPTSTLVDNQVSLFCMCDACIFVDAELVVM